MKKIVLGCAAVLLSLGLLAGCNKDDDVDDKINNTGPEENEPTDDGNEGTTDTGPGPETGGDGEPEGPTTYKLGALYSAEYTYKYFDGTAYTTSQSHFLNVTEEWGSAANVYVAAIEDDGVDNSFTMSFYDSGDLKYIGWSSGTAVEISAEPYTWVWDTTQELIVTNETTARFLTLYSGASIRAYEVNETNLTNPHVTLFETKPEDPEIPTTTVQLEQATSLISGKTYYLGDLVDGVYHLATETMSGYNLTTSVNFEDAVAVTATGDNDSDWTLTFSDEKYIYCYGSTTFFDLGISSEDTVPESGTKVFSWDSTACTIYTAKDNTGSYTGSYNYAYLEYYSGNVCFYGTNNVSTASNIAHFYQVVED